MGIGSISFWQQDQNFWNQAQSESQSSSASTSLINAMGSLETNKVKGLASIANQEALTRTNNQLVAALKSAVAASNGTSSTSSTSTPAAPPTPLPATGTGTIPLTAGTSLITLGIPPTGAITVSDGTNTPTYTSTGTDSVGDLINAINTSGPKNAQASAYLDPSGHLVIEAQNNTDTISVGGLFASNIGFGGTNTSFQPAIASSSSSAGSSSSASSSASTASTASSTTTSSTPAPALFNSAYALQTSGTAATLLASAGSSSSSINLLA
jgi:hypothetical protein